MGEQASDIIRTRRLELVDAEGHVRAELTVGEDGRPGLGLLDKEGQVRARLVLGGDGVPMLTLWGKTGTLRGGVSFGNEWKMGLTMTDPYQQVIWSAVPER